MDNITAILIVKGGGLVLCFVLAALTLGYGNKLFQDKRGKSEKHHLKIANWGLEFSTRSSGVFVMFLSVFWAWAAVQFNPTYEATPTGTKITGSQIQINPFVITASVGENMIPVDHKTQKALFETALQEAQKNNAVVDLRANGKSLKYSLGNLRTSQVDAGEGTITVSVLIPELNTTREVQYLPIQEGEIIKFFPLDQSISSRAIKEYQNAPNR